MTDRPPSTDLLTREIRQAMTELAHAAPKSPEFELLPVSNAMRIPSRAGANAARAILVGVAIATVAIIAARREPLPVDTATAPPNATDSSAPDQSPVATTAPANPLDTSDVLTTLVMSQLPDGFVAVARRQDRTILGPSERSPESLVAFDRATGARWRYGFRRLRTR